MEPLTPRQTDIVALARRAGRVEVEGLARHFEVTPQTIRRDLNELCERGVLARVHGGAIYPVAVRNYAYAARQMWAADAKERIGRRAAELVPDDAALVINIGTTTEAFARALAHRDGEGLMVVTNSINVADILREGSEAQVLVAGGLVRRADGGIVGEATVDFIRQFKVDFAVIGVSAIDEDGTLLDYDYREVRVAREIVARARSTILLADATKFERRAPVRIADLADLDVFVTDRSPPEPIRAICEARGVRLEIAGPAPGAEEARTA